MILLCTRTNSLAYLSVEDDGAKICHLVEGLKIESTVDGWLRSRRKKKKRVHCDVTVSNDADWL